MGKTNVIFFKMFFLSSFANFSAHPIAKLSLSLIFICHALLKYGWKVKEVIESSVLRNAFEKHFDHLKSIFVFHDVKSVYLRLPNIYKGLFLPSIFTLSFYC